MRKTPLKSRSPLTRKTALPARKTAGPSKWMVFSIPRKPRSKSEKERIYGGEYGDWLVTNPCLVEGIAGHTCWGAIRRCHTENGGMGRKADAPTQVPMCDGAHQLQHSIGVKSFERVFSVKLKDSAASYRARWLAEGER